MTAAARARAEAAERLSTLLSGQASQAEIEEIAAWRQADETHEDAWARLSSIWTAVGDVGDDPAILDMRSAALAAGKAPRAQGPRWWAPAFALAASVVLAIGGLTWFGPSGALPWGTGSSKELLAEAGWSPDESTRIGEIRTLALRDGTRVRLNTDSEVQTASSQKLRAVRLSRGEAYFDVAKDPERPFMVQAGPLEVTALGTQFSVRRLGESVIVTLVEGRVRVTADDGSYERILSPGEQLVARGHEIGLARIDAARAVSWTSGMLDFRRARLDAVVAEMNRYSSRQIVLTDPALAARPVSGLFPASDQDRFVDMLVAGEGVKVVRRTETRIELAPL